MLYMIPNRNQFLKIMDTVYTVEHYLAIKKKKILPFATTWVKLEGIILSKISQTQKEKYCIFSHLESKKF